MGLLLIRLWVSNSYVWGLVFLRLDLRDSHVGGVRDCYVLGLVFLPCVISINSYVWRLVFVCLGVRNSYVRG